MPLNQRKRWVIGLGLLALLAIAARPAWDILVFIFEDPLADHGAAVVSFAGEGPDDVWIVAVRVGETLRLTEGPSGTGYAISGPSYRGAMTGVLMSAPAGRQDAEVRYRIGHDDTTRDVHFVVDLLAQSQCDVMVRFAADGPRASACIHHRPASYGGTSRH